MGAHMNEFFPLEMTINVPLHLPQNTLKQKPTKTLKIVSLPGSKKGVSAAE